MYPKNELKRVGDVEKAPIEYDPFSGRNHQHSTTDRETLVHLLKASIGCGILAMPYVFSICGFIPALIASIVTSFISTHCSYILLTCAHILCKRTETPTMTFADVAEAAFASGPAGVRRLSTFVRYFVMSTLFITYFGSCSVSVIIMAENAQQMYKYYTDDVVSIRVCILLLVVPLILLAFMRNLKLLAPFSMLANLCMATAVGVTIYYFAQHLPELEQRSMINDVNAIPSAIAITIFAFNIVGIILPLENQMKTPQNFVGIFGVLSQGMTIVTVINILFGLLGYWCFGMETNENITLNLPVNHRGAQVVKIAVLANGFLSYSLQIYVTIECVWSAIKDRFGKKEDMANCIFRTITVVCAVLLAVMMPSMGPLIKLIGAFGFCILGLIFPVIIEVITLWEYGFGRFSWVLHKDIVCITFGLFALFLGTMSAVDEIIEKFSF